MTRWKAGAIHLAVSSAIASIVFLLMLLLWYPGAFFRAAGGERLAIILIVVDVVIGPLLTLIVFDLRKRELRRDLAVIACLQFGALVYGMHIMYSARPAYLAFVVDTFSVVRANLIDPEELPKAKLPEFSSIPMNGPKTIGVVPPTDAKEREQLLFSAIAGADAEAYPRYHVPYDTVKPIVWTAGLTKDQLIAGDNAARADVEAFMAKRQLNDAQVRFVPMLAPTEDGVVAVNQAGDVLGIVFAGFWRAPAPERKQ